MEGSMNTRSLTWYIAGPMTGYEDWNYPAFMAAEQRLRDVVMVEVVINPARGFDGNTSLPRESYLRKAFEGVARADALYLLHGWESSLGACAEVVAAYHCGAQFVLQRAEWNGNGECQRQEIYSVALQRLRAGVGVE